MRHSLRILLALALAGMTVACATSAPRAGAPPLAYGPPVDLERYMGDWYVIANIPYYAERGKVASLDRYALRADGRIDNRYVFRPSFERPLREYRAVATPVPGSGNAHWKVRFFWPFEVDLYVLEVSPDYDWALIGHPSRRYAWLFAREPAMDVARYAQLVQRFARHGYDPAALFRVPQFPEDLGKPGYQ